MAGLKGKDLVAVARGFGGSGGRRGFGGNSGGDGPGFGGQGGFGR